MTFYSEIVPLFRHLQELAELRYKLLREEAIQCFRSCDRNVNRISHILDGFLDIQMYGLGEKEFYLLCDYVERFDADCAADYRKMYKKFLEEELAEEEEDTNNSSND